MQNFFFDLAINDNNNTINIYYWNIHDEHLYFDPAMKMAYNESKPLIYSFDSENIFIPYTNWVVGPLKVVKLQSVTPFCDNFKVDCFKTFNVSFDYLKKNDNIDVNFNSLVSDSTGLNFTLNSTHLTIYWQTSKDLSFYIIECFFDKNYLIEDCLIAFRSDQNIFRFAGGIKYNNFHIIHGVKGLFYVKSIELSEVNENNNEIYDLNVTGHFVECKYIYLYESQNILFCVVNNELITIYKLKYNPDQLWLDKNYNWSFSNLAIDNIYIDFLKSYNCFIIKSNQNLIFYEIFLPTDDTFQITLIQKFTKDLTMFSDVYLFDLQNPLIILVDYENDRIEEYTLRNSFDLIFLRNYPTFNYDFESSFICNDRFLCLKITDDSESFVIIYNVTEPTSKLVRKKIHYDSTNDKIYPIKIKEENSDSNSANTFFHYLISTSSIFAIINQNYGVSIKIFKVCDILANVPEIFHDPKIVIEQFYQYKLLVSFTNEGMKEMIFFEIIVNITLTDSVISLKKNNDTMITINNPSLKGTNSYVLNLIDSPFLGPVQNYKISNDFFVQNNVLHYFDFYPFLNKKLDFEEDYDNERTKYGDFIKALYKDGILIVLSEKNLTFHLVENQYKIIYFDNSIISCTDMLLHIDLNLLYLFCYSKTDLHLKCYEFNSTNVLNNKTDILTNITSNDFSPFKGLFQSYMSAVMSSFHLFFLVDEGYYPELYKKKKTIYIYNLPRQSNNYTCGPPFIISDKDFDLLNNFFAMSDATDLQTYFINKTDENSTFYLILVLMKKSLKIINVNFTDNNNKVEINEDYTIEYQNFTKSSFNKDFVFYSATLLNLTFFSNETNQTNSRNDFSLTYILSSNLHIYEFNTMILSNNAMTSAIHIYTKSYSCIFTDSLRPRKFKKFVGSFCMKTDIIDGITENGINYFVLHKINDDNDTILNPVLALPIYLKNYNFQFIGKKKNYLDENSSFTGDYLILPSFSSLFTEFELNDTLSLLLRINPNGLTTKITAYNEISNSSIYINVVITSTEDSNFLYIILICVFVFAFVGIVGGLAFFIYRKRKNNKIKNSNIWVLDEELFSRMSDSCHIDEFLDTSKTSKKKVGQDSTTFGSHFNFRGTSFLRVKQKNEKWMES